MAKEDSEEKKNFKEEAKDKAKGFIAAAFGLVAALAWNDAITSLIEYIFPSKDGGILLKFIYAIVFTVVVILLTRYLLKDSK